jgi:hypothetical protein
MKVYTVLPVKDLEALTKFVQTVQDCGATGVTIFTRPNLLTPPTAPGQSETELQAKIDNAAARKDYRAAAAAEEELLAFRQSLKAGAAQGAEWVKTICTPIAEITQLIVLSNLHWPNDLPFTQSAFFSKVDQISSVLLTTGIGGIKQQTPLAKRVFIPVLTETLEPIAPVAGVPQNVPAGKPRHPSLPATLSIKEAEFATYRLGLDRGGQRRSKAEAGNMMGYSPNIAAKMEASVQRKMPNLEALLMEESIIKP